MFLLDPRRELLDARLSILLVQLPGRPQNRPGLVVQPPLGQFLQLFTRRLGSSSAYQRLARPTVSAIFPFASPYARVLTPGRIAPSCDERRSLQTRQRLRDNFQQTVDDIFDRHALGLRVEVRQHAMPEDTVGKRAYVLDGHVVASPKDSTHLAS